MNTVVFSTTESFHISCNSIVLILCQDFFFYILLYADETLNARTVDF